MRLLRQVLMTGTGLFVCADISLAFLNIEMQMGRRWYSNPLAISGTHVGGGRETSTRLLAEPTPRLPLSLGLSHIIHEGRASSFGPSVAAARLTVVSVEAKAAWRRSTRSTIYLRARYPLSAKMRLAFKDDTPSQSLRLRGGELTVGTSYRFLPIVSMVFELGQSRDEIEQAEGGYLRRPSRLFYAGVDIDLML